MNSKAQSTVLHQEFRATLAGISFQSKKSTPVCTGVVYRVAGNDDRYNSSDSDCETEDDDGVFAKLPKLLPHHAQVRLLRFMHG